MNDTLSWLLEPCKTADELDLYLRHFLKLDLPWDTVDDDSTSSPMKFIWQVYKTMLTGKGNHTHILAASRNCMKTLTSSTLQFLSMLHFRRDGVHISAELNQSAQAITYLDGFMGIPELQPYQDKNNVRIKQFVGLPPNSLTDKPNVKLQVVTATKKGANSSRASFLTFDEVDLTPQQILDEAAYIGDPTRDKNRFNPIFVYLSSRKSPDGPIQNLMDRAEKANTGDEKTHKWSSADFMQACPPEIHKPEGGMKQAYLHTETLKVFWGKEVFEQIVPEATRSQYKELAVYEGCKTCPVFIPCLGYSAKQRGESKALRTRAFVKSIVSKISDPSVIIAQTLNFKPETTAIVFKTFSRFKHVKDPIDFYQWACGKRFNPFNLPDEEIDAIEEAGDVIQMAALTPTKISIYNGMVAAGWTFISGVDFGYSPDPAVSEIIGYHKRQKRACVLTLESANGFANHLWAEHTCKHLFKKFPVEFVGPDLADPAAPTYFAKHKVMSLDTKPSRIEPGVSFIRGLLWNPISQSTNFAILDDSQMDNKNIMMIEAFERWTHKKTPLGFDLHRFEDNEWTHTLDALRYGLAPFLEDLKISTDVKVGPPELRLEVAAAAGNPEALQILKEKNEAMNQIQQHMKENFGLDNIFGQPGEYKAEVLKPSNSPYGKQQEETATKPGGGGGIRFKF